MGLLKSIENKLNKEYNYMKTPIQYMLTEYGAWLAIGIAVGVAIVIFFTSRSAGKILGVIVTGLAISFCCLNSELVLMKVSQFFQFVFNLWTPGG
jgi:hypothetical protein